MMEAVLIDVPRSMETVVWISFGLGIVLGGVVASIGWCVVALVGKIDRNMDAFQGKSTSDKDDLQPFEAGGVPGVPLMLALSEPGGFDEAEARNSENHGNLGRA